MAAAWAGPFLLHVRRTGNVRFASALAGVSFQACYELRTLDGTFRAQWDGALRDYKSTHEKQYRPYYSPRFTADRG